MLVVPKKTMVHTVIIKIDVFRRIKCERTFLWKDQTLADLRIGNFVNIGDLLVLYIFAYLCILDVADFLHFDIFQNLAVEFSTYNLWDYRILCRGGIWVRYYNLV